MKKFLLFFTLLLSLNLFAQNEEGTIYYNETVKFKIELPEAQKHLLAQMPTSKSQEKVLYFTEEKSLYMDIGGTDEEQEINQGSEESGVHIKMSPASMDNRLLKDFANKKIIDQRDFLGKKFLIEGDMEKIKWKMTGEQKKILDYVCQKAELQDTSQSVIAWFAPQIPVANGPDMYGQLPGMILEISRNDGTKTTIATKVELTKLPADIMKTPKKGKKVSREEFDKIRDEKMKEMGGNGSGATVIKIKMRN